MKNFVISHFLAKKANGKSKNPSFLKRVFLATVIRRKLNKRDAERNNRR